jgi:hypothetical protein
MDLQRIDPGIKGFENRVFECGKCYTMKAVPAAIHRMTVYGLAYLKEWHEGTDRHFTGC